MTRFLLLLASVGAITVACTNGTPEEPNAPPTAPSTPVALESVRPELQGAVNVTRLYNDTCSKCHGMNGEGGGGGTRSVLTKEKYDQRYDQIFFDAIKKGVPEGGMDAYGPTMSDPEIWALVVHMRELQGKALREQFGDPKAVKGVYASQRHPFQIETVIDSGLTTPWAIDWLPDGRMLVTNRPGSISVVKDGKIESTIEGLPKSIELGQGGMMDLTVHPNYAKNGWIYLAFSDPSESNPRHAMTKIVRGKLKFEGSQAKWVSEQKIFQVDQKFYTGAGFHFGSRIVFDGKGYVYFVVGERGGNMLAQQVTNPFGKIYRLKEDGTVPTDNPFSTNPDAIPGIWSLGHRNPQGLAFDLQGNLWDTEHGPRGGDEVNRIQKGANYGWPVVAFSINYNDSPFVTPWPKPEDHITQPVFRWLPSIGASGLDVAHGPAFPDWKGDLLAGGLSGANLDRIRIKDDKVVEREELVHGMGRVREVSVAKDGTIYVALNQPDKIIRLIPAK